MLLYLANGSKSVTLYNIQKPDIRRIFTEERGEQIVAIGAYCLMPNHYHLLLKEVVEGGISEFMRKVGIAYTMYFNTKNDRVGNLFLRPFRSRHISTDRYFQRVLQYIHCNPAELSEPGWKSGKVRSITALESKLSSYPFSSLQSYIPGNPRSKILSSEGFEIADHPSPRRMIEDARAYYADIAEDRFER